MIGPRREGARSYVRGIDRAHIFTVVKIEGTRKKLCRKRRRTKTLINTVLDGQPLTRTGALVRRKTVYTLRTFSY